MLTEPLPDSLYVGDPPYSRFPGAQPISFTTIDLQKLIKDESVPTPYPFSGSDEGNRAFVFSLDSEYDVRSSYWVCEKSDGIRVLLFISTLGETQNVFLVRAQSVPFA